MEAAWVWLILAFFLIAFFYSMVGFGGGSSYLAVLALASVPYEKIPPTALICNLVVASLAFFHFYREGHFELRKVLPFVVSSIPMAFWGGTVLIEKRLFFLLLGLSLLIAAIRMVIPDERFETAKEVSRRKAWFLGLPIGGGLGFLSGLIGIGGGIFLSPLLILMRWVNVKQASACASFFIVVNSFSGLLGQFQKGFASYDLIMGLGIAVFLGGLVGSRLGSFHLPKRQLQRVLAVLILMVSLRLLWGVL